MTKDPRIDTGSRPRPVPPEAQFRYRFERFSGFVEEYSSKLSLSGIFLAASNPRPVGSEVSFDFKLSDGFRLLHGQGQVVWVRKSSSPGRPAGMGVRFVALDEKGRELVLKVLEEQVKAGGAPFEVDAVPADASNVVANAPVPVPTPELPPMASPQPSASTDSWASEDPTVITARPSVAPGFGAPWGQDLREVPTDLLEEHDAIAVPSVMSPVFEEAVPAADAGARSSSANLFAAAFPNEKKGGDSPAELGFSFDETPVDFVGPTPSRHTGDSAEASWTFDPEKEAGTLPVSEDPVVDFAADVPDDDAESDFDSEEPTVIGARRDLRQGFGAFAESSETSLEIVDESTDVEWAATAPLPSFREVVAPEPEAPPLPAWDPVPTLKLEPPAIVAETSVLPVSAPAPWDRPLVPPAEMSWEAHQAPIPTVEPFSAPISGPADFAPSPPAPAPATPLVFGAASAAPSVGFGSQGPRDFGEADPEFRVEWEEEPAPPKSSKKALVAAMTLIAVLGLLGFLFRSQVLGLLGMTKEPEVAISPAEPLDREESVSVEKAGPSLAPTQEGLAQPPPPEPLPQTTEPVPPTPEPVTPEPLPEARPSPQPPEPLPVGREALSAANLIGIKASKEPNATEVVLSFDGPVPAEAVTHDPIAWAADRERLIINGSKMLANQREVRVASPELRAIRIGEHPGELWIVFDLPVGAKIVSVEPRGLALHVRLSAGG